MAVGALKYIEDGTALNLHTLHLATSIFLSDCAKTLALRTREWRELLDCLSMGRELIIILDTSCRQL
jgi:hypothetical protein